MIYASQSSLAVHRACPQKWRYRHLAKLRRIEEEAVGRDFGSWWHMLRAAEALARGRALGSLQSEPGELRSTDDGPRLPVTASPEEVLHAASVYWEARTPSYRDAAVQVLGEPLAARLRALSAAWDARWAVERATERPLAVEMRWERSLPGVTLVGYVDEIYYDVRRDLVVVRDQKGGASLDTQTTADDMMDSQLQLYAWGASPTVSSWNLGKIRATAYDRSRMTAPKPPELTLGGRLRMIKGEPSVSGCDLDTYLAWAKGPDGEGVWYPGNKKDGSAQGFYTAEQRVIEKLSSPAAMSIWFQRTLTPVNLNLVRTHLRAAVDSAEDMDRTKRRVEETGEAPRNLSRACRWCDYVALCRAEMVGGPGLGHLDLRDYGLQVERPGSWQEFRVN